MSYNDPINVVRDFHELMSNDNDFLSESFESGIQVNSYGSDKENSSINLVVDNEIEYVSPVVHTRRRQPTQKTKSQTPRTSRRTKAKAKTNEQLIISIGSDDEDSCLNTLNNELPNSSGAVSKAISSDIISLTDDDDDGVPSLITTSTFDYASQAELLNEEVRVKVSFLLEGNMVYNLRRFQPFKHIYKIIAEEKNINIDYILLSKNDYKIRHYDTPESINLTVIDILVGETFNRPVTFPDNTTVNNVKDENSISLTILTESKRRNKRIFTIQKQHCMFVLFVEIAEHLECDVKDISLWFDGEKVDPAKKPIELDIDDGECLELKCRTTENVNWNI